MFAFRKERRGAGESIEKRRTPTWTEDAIGKERARFKVVSKARNRSAPELSSPQTYAPAVRLASQRSEERLFYASLRAARKGPCWMHPALFPVGPRSWVWVRGARALPSEPEPVAVRGTCAGASGHVAGTICVVANGGAPPTLVRLPGFEPGTLGLSAERSTN